MTTETEQQDAYREDILGAGYEVRSLALRPDEEGDVVATLVPSQAEDAAVSTNGARSPLGDPYGR